MKKNNLLLLSLFIVSTILFFACKTDSEFESVGEIQSYTTGNTTDNGYYIDKIYSDEEYAVISEYLDLPNLNFEDYLTRYDFSLANLNSTVEVHTMKATLGKVLFYDKELSIDGSTSCASCHKQENAFADNVAFSKGINGHQTDRNSFALGSFISLRLEYYGTEVGATTVTNKLFWDERADNFIDQMTQTFNNPEEMGIDNTELEDRVNAKEYYNVLAKKAFGTEHLTHLSIKEAIAEFMAAFHSSKSSFDYALRDMGSGTTMETDFNRFSDSENLGKQLFNENCGACHASSLVPISFNNFIRSANNGLEEEYSDQGIGAITSDSSDDGKFKIPSLRNIAVTGPYMHDGRFETLEEVVDFYIDGVQGHPNLNPQLQDDQGNPKKLSLTNPERQALLDFLNTLTDNSFLTNPLYKDPFKS